MAKTNKALQKRLKITGKGKILIRQGGKIHFRAKQRRAKQLKYKKWRKFKISKKTLGRYLPYN
jgi:ribosomal protein L35